MDVLGRMNAAFADRFAEPRATRATRVEDVAACGCAEPAAKDCPRRLCSPCCGLDCTPEHAARDHGADE